MRLFFLSIAGFTIEVRVGVAVDYSDSSRLLFGIDTFGITGPAVTRDAIVSFLDKPNSIENIVFQERRYGLGFAMTDGLRWFRSAEAVARLNMKGDHLEVFTAGSVLSDDCMVGFLRLMTGFLAVRAGGIPFHCSGVSYHGKGLVFSGPSGIGKSTVWRLLEPVCGLMNDEYNIIRPINEEYVVFPTFFTNVPALVKMTLCPVKYGRVYFLEQGTAHRVTVLSRRDATHKTLAGCYIMPMDNGFNRMVMDNVCGFVEKRQMRGLCFSEDASLVDFLAQQEVDDCPD